jgi:hypothetical protein
MTTPRRPAERSDTELRWRALRIAVKDRPTQKRMLGIRAEVIVDA